jgi:hypothetical protein
LYAPNELRNDVAINIQTKAKYNSQRDTHVLHSCKLLDYQRIIPVRHPIIRLPTKLANVVNYTETQGLNALLGNDTFCTPVHSWVRPSPTMDFQLAIP